MFGLCLGMSSLFYGLNWMSMKCTNKSNWMKSAELRAALTNAWGKNVNRYKTTARQIFCRISIFIVHEMNLLVFSSDDALIWFSMISITLLVSLFIQIIFNFSILFVIKKNCAEIAKDWVLWMFWAKLRRFSLKNFHQKCWRISEFNLNISKITESK